VVDAAIDQDAGAPADSLDDFRQNIDRADALIELAPAMVSTHRPQWPFLIRSTSRQLNRSW
jgi:hypothetical protein